LRRPKQELLPKYQEEEYNRKRENLRKGLLTKNMYLESLLSVIWKV